VPPLSHPLDLSILRILGFEISVIGDDFWVSVVRNNISFVPVLSTKLSCNKKLIFHRLFVLKKKKVLVTSENEDLVALSIEN